MICELHENGRSTPATTQIKLFCYWQLVHGADLADDRCHEALHDSTHRALTIGCPRVRRTSLSISMFDRTMRNWSCWPAVVGWLARCSRAVLDQRCLSSTISTPRLTVLSTHDSASDLRRAADMSNVVPRPSAA